MKNKKILLITTFLIVAVLIVIYYLFQNSTLIETSLQKTNLSKINDKKIITGSWLRTDSEYLIKIAAVNDDGSLLAQYFNPNPINVGSANWETISGDLKIIIELSDVNYPGSTYTLNYLPDKDMLAGEYYQAVEGLIFYVEFSRYKAN